MEILGQCAGSQLDEGEANSLEETLGGFVVAGSWFFEPVERLGEVDGDTVLSREVQLAQGVLGEQVARVGRTLVHFQGLLDVLCRSFFVV